MTILRNIFLLVIPFIIFYIWILVNMHSSNRTFKEELYMQVAGDAINFFIAMFVLMIAFIIGGLERDDFDMGIFVTIVITYLVSIAAIILKKYILNLVEDNAKLTDDLEGIIKRYPLEKWYEYRGCKFPIVLDAIIKGKQIEIEDSDKMYQIPEEIKSFENRLYTAHDTSHVYNQLNIRVDDWELKDDIFYLHTSRTTYFKSLVTNRALDFKVLEQKTVREILLYGPFLPTLKNSPLSNHLGFNGFIISCDGYVPFILRKKEMSVGKRIYGPSVAASLKTKYALDNDEHILTSEGIEKAILKEIEDEIKIKKEDISFNLKDNLLCAYREGYEGTKPQLLFYATSKLTKEEIENNFHTSIKAKSNKRIEEVELEDGTSIKWISVNDFQDITFDIDSFSINGDLTQSNSPSNSSFALFVKMYEELNL